MFCDQFYTPICGFVYGRLLSFLFNFLSLLFLILRIMTLRISCNGGVLVSCYWYNLLKAWFIMIPFVYNIYELDLIALRSFIRWKVYIYLFIKIMVHFQSIWHEHDSKLAPELQG